MDTNDKLAISELAEVSSLMMEGYARFIGAGVPGQTVALAMLGATINLYDMFDMRADLPDLLRIMAGRIEEAGWLN